MSVRQRLTTVERVHDERSWLFTVRNEYDEPAEVLLVPCEDGVEAWVNRCTHQNQRLDTGHGATIRDGEIVCPRHGSTFDGCSGYCDNGEAAETTLRSVEIDVDDGVVYLTDDEMMYLHEGETTGDEDDDGPSSTSHISF